MKHLFCISVLTLLFSFASANTTHIVSDSIAQQVQQKVEVSTHNDEKEDVGSITLAVNAINNIITWSAVIVAILTLLAALFGYFGYNRLNNKVSDKIKEIDCKKQEFDDCITQTKKLDGKLKAQEKYMCNSNKYLYESVEKIVNQLSDTTGAKVIYTELVHSYHITNLYSSTESSTESTTKFAALAYLQSNGTRIDIEHLEYVSNFDFDENHKKWAREIIGIIKHK